MTKVHTVFDMPFETSVAYAARQKGMESRLTPVQGVGDSMQVATHRQEGRLQIDLLFETFKRLSVADFPELKEYSPPEQIKKTGDTRIDAIVESYFENLAFAKANIVGTTVG